MQDTKFLTIAALAAGVALSAFALSGCATTSTGTAAASGSNATASSSGGPQRELTPAEKKAIIDSVSPSLRNPASAKWKWNTFPSVVTESSVNYCATVDAGSPYAAYNGHQAYIVEAQMAGGHVTGAVIGLIAGGKDFAIVTTMCQKYGLDPKTAS